LRARELVLDTSVIVEYINEDSPYDVDRLFSAIFSGSIKAYLTPITLSEVVYTSYRVYREAGVDKPNEEALKFAEWISNIFKVEEITEELAKKAGELRKRFRLALPDIYVITTGLERGASPLFLKPEEEMLKYEEELRKLGILFWNEIKSDFLQIGSNLRP
jgi:predicted nucleic acid-binding protein